VKLPGEEPFFSHVHLHGGPAPVRRFLPELIDLIWNRTINPGKVFDLELCVRVLLAVPLACHGAAAVRYVKENQRRDASRISRPRCPRKRLPSPLG
jgi:hypothetical protein